jgi:hypothetical protein
VNHDKGPGFTAGALLRFTSNPDTIPMPSIDYSPKRLGPGACSSSLFDKPEEGPRYWDAALRCWVRPKMSQIAQVSPPAHFVRPRNEPGPAWVIRDRMTGHTLWRITAHDYRAARQEADTLARANGGRPVDVSVTSA